MVAVCVGISRSEKLMSVVAEGLVLDWKGKRGWGYAWARWNKQVGLVRVVACLHIWALV